MLYTILGLRAESIRDSRFGNGAKSLLKRKPSKEEVRTMSKRDTHKYHLKGLFRIIRSGITNNPDRREKEHKRKYGKNVRLQTVGRRTTREGARAWEKRQKRGTP